MDRQLPTGTVEGHGGIGVKDKGDGFFAALELMYLNGYQEGLA